MSESEPPNKPRARFVLKYALVALASVMLLLIGVAGYLVATFDAAQYHHLIARVVKEKTGRALHIEGGISLSLWPPVGVRIERVSLDERDSEETFASVEAARVHVELLPLLLSHEIVAAELALTGMSIRVVRYENGRLNIDDLIGGEGPPPQFDIRGIRVQRSVLSYTDRASKAAYELADLTFDAPRLANSVQTPIELAFTGRDLDAEYVVRAKARGRLAMDVGARRYAMDAAVIDLEGAFPAIAQLKAALKADLLLRLDAGEFVATGLACSLSGKVYDRELAMTLDADRIVAQPKQVQTENLRVAGETRGTPQSVSVKLVSPSAVLQDRTVRARDTGVDVSVIRGDHHVRAGLTAGLDADIGSRTLALTVMRSNFEVKGPGLPRKGLAGTAAGSARIDAAGEIVQVAVSGAVDESRLQAQLKATGFSTPVYAFNVAIDKLDAERYLTDVADSRRKAARPAEVTSLIEPFARLPATGTVTVGRLTAAGVSARNVRFEIK